MIKSKVLIYAHYYAPDVASTGQILQDLAEGISDEFDVTVICTVPSYTGVIEERYRANKFYVEIINDVRVIRVPVPEFSKTSKKSRIQNILAYYINARKATRMVDCVDYVFAISQPPILGGMLGVYGSKIIKTKDGKHPKFIYNIQDFNPEQIRAVGYIRNRLIIDVAMWLDKRTCRKSDLVITVGRDLVETLKKRFKNSTVPKYAMINNWIDDDMIYPLQTDDPGVIEFKDKYGLLGKFVFMYSGNIGLYYDLEGLFTVIERFKNTKTADGKDVVFAFVGAGSLLDRLIKYKNDHDMDNVVFIPYQDKEKLIFSLNSADVHFCISAKGLKGVSVPSKIYGIVGVGKVVIGILEKGSEAELLISEIGCGYVINPGQYDVLERQIKEIICGSIERTGELLLNDNDFMRKKISKKTSINAYKQFFFQQ